MYYPVGTFGEEFVSTFWNPLDVFGATLSNDNYTVTINEHGDDGFAPSGGLENVDLFLSDSWYWEILVAACDSSAANFPMLSFGLRDRFDGLSFGATNGTNPLYDNRNVRSSDESMLTPLYPDFFVWHSNLPVLGVARDLLEAGGGNPDATITVDLTGVSGFTSLDRLMFALKRATGEMWLGKNGTWFNSGNPATGANPQITGLVEPAYSGGNDPHWRLFFGTNANDYTTYPVQFHGCFGNSIFPQAYTPPAGFTSLLPRSTADFSETAWNVRASGAEQMFAAAVLAAGAWNNGGTLDVGDNASGGASAARMQPDGLYYFEMLFTDAAASNLWLGIRSTDEGPVSPTSGVCALWSWVGTLGVGAGPITAHTTGIPTYTNTDKLGFAVNRVTGKMWLRKNGTWVNSGDPEAGTNPQFSNIPNTGTFVAQMWVVNDSHAVRLVTPASFTYSVPAGFYAGIPLTVASA